MMTNSLKIGSRWEYIDTGDRTHHCTIRSIENGFVSIKWDKGSGFGLADRLVPQSLTDHMKCIDVNIFEEGLFEL